ncbi:MAG: ATP-binding protein [Candidatus Sericytochromatia bacterium]
MRLPTRVGLVFAVAMATLVAVLAVTLGTYQIAQRDYRTISEVHAPNVDAGRRMMQLTQDLFIEQTIYIDHPEDRPRVRQLMTLHEAEWETLYATASRYAESSEERAVIGRIGSEFRSLVRSGRQIRQVIADGRTDEARRLHRDVARPAFWQLRADAERFHAINRDQIAGLTAGSIKRFERAGWFAIAAALIGTLAAAALWWSASAAIVRPLRTLTRAMGALEDQRFIEAHDPHAVQTVELAALQAGFNRMSNQLEEARRQLTDSNATLEAQVAARTTQLREANRQLEDLVAELRTLDQLKSQFMSVMSHELLTPINFIVGFGSALEDELMGSLNDQQLDAVQKMMVGADRLTRMVRNTLEYTQLEAGTLAMWPQAVEYHEVVQDALAAVEPGMAARDQHLTVTWPDEPPTLHADPDRVRQILIELLDNASKFSPDGAEIRLMVSDAGDDMVTTEVRDPGVGIPEGSLAKLFMPFYQVDSSSTRAHGGMGLGLAIAHHLAARMGGSMLVASSPNHGTTLRFTLPRHVPARLPEGSNRSEADA